MYDNRPSVGGRHNNASFIARQAYSFPLLKNNEIVLTLKEIGIPIMEENLSHPEKDKEQIRRMMEQLTEICAGIPRDELNQPAFSGLSVLNYPELHEDSIPHINNFRMCQRMMETCGITDYSINDLIAPTAKRLRRQLSGIINFAKFREERLALLTDLTRQRDDLSTQRDETRLRGEDLDSKLSILKEQTSEEAKEIARLESECELIKTNLQASNLKQAEIREEMFFLKAENNKLKDAISSSTLKRDDLYAQKKKLQEQIVNSPERFRKQIIDTEGALAEVHGENKVLEKKVRELRAWIDHIDVAQCEVSSALEGVIDLRSEVEKQKSYVADVASKKQDLGSKREVLSQVEQNVQKESRKASRLEEKMSQLRIQATARASENQENIESVHKKLIDSENLRMQLTTKAGRVEADVIKVEKEGDAQKVLYEQERQSMHASYARLEGVVLSHLQKLRATLDDDLIV